jgi:hypothetical protein
VKRTRVSALPSSGFFFIRSPERAVMKRTGVCVLLSSRRAFSNLGIQRAGAVLGHGFASRRRRHQADSMGKNWLR